MNSSNKNSKSSVPCVIPQLIKSKKSLIIIKARTLKKNFSKLVLQLSATNAKIMGMLLPIVQAHLSLPLMTEFALKHLSLIVLFLWKSLLWLRRYCHSSFSFPSFIANPTFSAASSIDPCCCYLYCHQALPPLQLTPSLSFLWSMLGTKLKFSTDFILIADQYQVIEPASSFASSFASHVHEQSTKISDKIARNNTDVGYELMIGIG